MEDEDNSAFFIFSSQTVTAERKILYSEKKILSSYLRGKLVLSETVRVAHCGKIENEFRTF